MGDDFRYWGLKDIERVSNFLHRVVRFTRECRHSDTESIENERAAIADLSDAMYEFNQERLAPNGGRSWVRLGEPPIKLHDPLTEVDAHFIYGVLPRAIPAYGSGVTWGPLDGRYYLPSQRDAARVIAHSIVNTFPYLKNKFDCDDFAEALRNDFRMAGINCCAYIVDRSGGHAYNMLLFADGQYWFVEPQTDGIMSIGKGIYKLERGEIVL